MKKKAIYFLGIIIAVGMMGMIFFQMFQGEHIPEHWPDRDKMEKNLTKKHYEVTVSNIIQVNGASMSGERIKASKGKNFVEAFWYPPEADFEIIDQYLSDTYGSASYHRVGNTLYFGTKKALKDAGVVLVNE
jgi:hypothetical protein